MRILVLLPIFITSLHATALGQCVTDVFAGRDAFAGHDTLEPDERFGAIMEVSGDLAVISSRRDSTPGGARGTTFVYERGPDEWTLVQTLAPAKRTTLSIFGTDISIDGSRIGIGAYMHVGRSGPAFLYDRAASGWMLTNTLVAPERTPNDVYGRSVAVDGDTAIVSRSKDSGRVFEAGSVYVFEERLGSWMNTAKLEPSVPEYQGRFGNRVDLDGDCVMIGAWWTGSGTRGAIYFFERDQTGVWSEVFKFEGMSLTGNLGTSVLLDGTRAFAGQPRGASRVHVFERGAGGWAMVDTLQSSDLSPSSFFGTSCYGARYLRPFASR